MAISIQLRTESRAPPFNSLMAATATEARTEPYMTSGEAGRAGWAAAAPWRSDVAVTAATAMRRKPRTQPAPMSSPPEFGWKAEIQAEPESETAREATPPL